jgi:trans-AT polyketide synthase/acyltransferase/oxidoreductase domain-containing protein
MQAWLFPGQGAQRKGIGAELFSRFPEHCRVAERILGYSVAEACQEDTSGRLRQTQHVQPVLFVVNALSHLARAEMEAEPSFLAGHSLGEVNALWAAGCFDFETGLGIVRRRGELMGRIVGGGMAAVVGLDPGKVTALVARSGVAGLDVANYNSATQVVLSGPHDCLAAIATAVRDAGGRYCPLNVSAAFHSRHMREAAQAFGEALGDVRFEPPRIAVVSNVTARPYPPDGIADLLVRQIYSPVRWQESMNMLIDAGVRDAVEVGPGSVLTDLWRACAAERSARTAVPTATWHRPPATVPRIRPGEPALAPAGSLAEEANGSRDAAAGLGSAEFRRDYGLRYAYLAGSMYHGISSAELVIRMGEAGLMGFFGAGGLPLEAVGQAIVKIKSALGQRANFGMNLLYSLHEPALERATAELYVRHDVRFVEAAAYTQITPALVRFRFAGARRDARGCPVAPRHVLAKASRFEIADAFMSPPPAAIVDELEREGSLTPVEAAVARELPVGEDVCVEADSAGHTDGGVSLALIPAITRLRDDVVSRFGYRRRIRIGASGGLGSPEAVAAAFVLGADFVLTGSVNQCSPEAGTSALVKEMLAGLDVHDTAYAPAGDMFGLGAEVQVVRKGTLFAGRANKLYRLYRQHESLTEIDAYTRAVIERSYFKRTIDEVWSETKRHHLAKGRPEEIEKAEANPKHKMALVFQWYFAHTTLAALDGHAEDKVNFQVHCGPAMGAFNRFVAGSELADWRNRHVEVIAEKLMAGAAGVLESAAPARCQA